MSITRTLPNFPVINQLSEPTMDGNLDENAQNNCVVASIAAALEYLTGRTFDGDELKDAVYGQGTTGPMSAAHFVAYCAAQGVSLTPVNASQAGLVAALHSDIAAGNPALVTMPSNWGTAPANPLAPSGSTHVGVCCGDGAGELRVMNPWGGFWQDQSDLWWQARLCYGQVWTLQKAGATVGTPGTPTTFYGLNYTADPVVWHCPLTGFDVQHGFLAFYQGVHGPQGQTGTQILGLPKSNEYPSGSLTKQDFERGRLVYDPSKGNPWMITLENDFDANLNALRTAASAAAQAQAALTQAQSDLAAMQAQRDALSAQLAQVQSAPPPAPTAQQALDLITADLKAAGKI